MKRILTLTAAIMMVLLLTVTSFAAGAFVASPSGIAAPKLISAYNESVDCDAELVIAPYSEQKSNDKMKAAYNSIKSTNDLTTLNSDLANIAKEYGVSADKLVVSDLFDIHYEKCDDHDSHGAFTITIKPNTVDNYVAIMHFNGTTWEIIDSEVNTEDGEITFITDDLSPFALVAHDGTGSAPADFGPMIAIIVISLIVLLIIAATIAYFVIKKKK